MLDLIFERYRGLKDFAKDTVEKVHEINRKYSKPRVKMNRATAAVLLLLRLYLLFLVLILVYKFVTVLRGG